MQHSLWGDFRRLGLIWTLIAALVVVAGGAVVAPASAAGSVTFSKTQTIPVPPASTYAGSGGGDGWAVALSDTSVFNVFHHSGATTVACHLQSNASPCWNPRTVTDADGHNFAASGHPGLWLERSTNRLYVYGTRTSDKTGGVVCIDTVLAATNPNPFCGFTALSAVGEASTDSGISALSAPAMVGTKWYAFNYFPGSGTTGTRNRLLCFDTSTHAACAAQPFAVNLGAGTLASGDFPTPAVAAIGTRVIIGALMGADDRLSCFDTATGATCAGSWPIATGLAYNSNYGAPFPMLDATGSPTGFCLPTGADPCFTLSGASAITPPGLPAAVPSTAGWNGSAVVLGSRVYVPSGWSNQVDCFNWATGSGCANFPKTFDNLNLLYTVNPDPARPACLWVNADGGSGQIQNFDAFSGNACGAGPIRVLASSFVVPTVLCQPATYTALQITEPVRAVYTSGSVAFQDGDANPIGGAGDESIDASGSVSLSGKNLSTGAGLPQFLITLNGAAGSVGEVIVKLSWTGTDDPSCIGPGTTTSGGDTGPGACGNTVFLAAMGSGEHYSGPADLTNSPELVRLYNGMQATRGTKQIGVRVVNYRAASAETLSAGLDTVTGANPADYVAKLQARAAANSVGYLAGQDAGVAELARQFADVRLKCPRGTKIVLGGYSQGSMVVHEFLYQLSKSTAKADKKAVIGVALIADPERVRNSAIREMSSAPDASAGVCSVLRAVVDCTAPDPLADIPADFRHEAISVCIDGDIVCDTSSVLSDLTSVWSDPSALKFIVEVGAQRHVIYRAIPATTKAGERIGRRISAK